MDLDYSQDGFSCRPSKTAPFCYDEEDVYEREDTPPPSYESLSVNIPNGHSKVLIEYFSSILLLFNYLSVELQDFSYNIFDIFPYVQILIKSFNVYRFIYLYLNIRIS